MDRMTDHHNRIESVSSFYDALAEEYDVMTGFEKRFAKERPFFRTIVEQHGVTSAVDAGCGTGFHSLLLAQLGVQVTAVDISSEMLKSLNNHASEMTLSVETIQANFEELPKKMRTGVDAVFSLGNSLAHVLSREELRRVLEGFHSILNPRGILVVQTLNYDRIMSHRESIQSTGEVGDKTFTRSYEYLGEKVLFNISTKDRSRPNAKETTISVFLRPVMSGEFIGLLAEAGFVDVKTYGAISLEEFKPQESKDLVVIARKQRSNPG